MTYSFTTSATESFTLTHARELASRVMADMGLCSRYYGKPTADQFDSYREELVQLLKNGYLESYEFGFKKNDERVVSFRYRVNTCGDLEGGSPGGIYSRADIAGAAYFNFVTYSSRFLNMDSHSKERFEKGLPVQRTAGSAPVDGKGYWIQDDRAYAAGGHQLTRGTFRPY